MPGSYNSASLSEASTGQKYKPSLAVLTSAGRLLHYRNPITLHKEKGDYMIYDINLSDNSSRSDAERQLGRS